jgi:Mg2+/Co2+ transporter CorB
LDPSAIQPPAADAGTIIQFIILIILVLLSGFFSSAETALTTVNRIRMRALEEEGNRRAATVNKFSTATVKCSAPS